MSDEIIAELFHQLFTRSASLCILIV